MGASFGSTLAAPAHISLSRPCLPGGGGGTGVDQNGCKKVCAQASHKVHW